VTITVAPGFVKTLGDDERSADRLFRPYRRIVPHDTTDERLFSSLRRGVEHEALVALAARAEPHRSARAYEVIEGYSLDHVPPGDVTDEILDAVVMESDSLAARFAVAGIAHQARRHRRARTVAAAGTAAWAVAKAVKRRQCGHGNLAPHTSPRLQRSARMDP
jgi:glycosyltransferase 2 family protein